MNLLLFNLDDLQLDKINKLSTKDKMAIRTWSIVGNKVTYITRKGILESQRFVKGLNSLDIVFLYNGRVVYDTKSRIPLVANLIEKEKAASLMKHVAKKYSEVLPIIDKLDKALVPKEKYHIYPSLYKEYITKVSYFSRISYNNIAKIGFLGPIQQLRSIENMFKNEFSFNISKSLLEVFPQESESFQETNFTSQFSKIYEITGGSTFFNNPDVLVALESSSDKLKERANFLINNKEDVNVLFNAICLLCNSFNETHCNVEVY